MNLIKKVIIAICLLFFNTEVNSQIYKIDSLYEAVSSQNYEGSENITYLYLSIYHNPHLLKQLHKFKKLKVLEIYDMSEISDLSFLEEMNDLEILSIQKCGLNTFTINPSTLSKLRHLNLSDNNIQQIIDLDKLPDLESLIVNYNKFKEIPDISRLYKLKEFSIHSNKLDGIVDFRKFPSNITYLNLGSNSLNKIKGISKRNESIINLNLMFNDFKSLPSNIYKLKQLQKLDVSYNQLIRFPKSITKTNIFEIIARDNQLKDFPQGFKWLRILDLTSNQFNEIPNPSDRGLLKLYIANNNIKTIPNYVLEWKELFFLDISYTQITNFPKTPFSSNFLEVKAVETMIEQSEIESYKEKYGIKIQTIELDM